jgi:ribosomal-protein-alanine N-acetyltransferase
VSEGLFADLLAGELRLSTARFDLSPLTSADAEDLFTAFSDPEVVRFMDIDPHVDIAQTQAVIDWAEGLRAAGEGVRWAVRRREGGGFVGTCGFNTLVLERGCRGEIGYDVRRAAWGERVMNEVLPALLGFGFGALGLRRIEALVTPGNTWSCALLERHGFEREGVLREYGFWKDTFWDQIVYAKLG